MFQRQLLIRAAIIVASVTACASDSSAPDLQSLDITGKLESAADSVRGVVTIRNRASRPASFGIADFSCAVTLELYSQTGALLWDQDPINNSFPGGCKWISTTVTLKRDETHRAASSAASLSALRSAVGTGTFETRIRVIFARLVPIAGQSGAFTTQVDSVADVRSGPLTL